MTHDELLAEISLASRGEYASLAVALIAVVELHKPRAYKNETDEMYIKGWNAAMDRVIQAIEKELQ